MNVFRARVWSGLGGCLLAALPLVTEASGTAAPPATQPAALVDLGGEWGGEGGVLPSSYRLRSADPDAWNYDGAPQQRAYAGLVYRSYGEAHRQAQQLQQRIDALLARPSAKSLAAARRAWLAARPAYLLTEAYRYYDGPIDVDAATGKPGPEIHINAWPLNEAYIDYVRGDPQAGLVQADAALTRDSLVARDQMSDEADVTTGWHAIEFLLWGQDFNHAGPGQRPHSDYLPGDVARERRRQYLRLLAQMLVDDLAGLQRQWAPGLGDNYRARFEALLPREALGRMVNGMANLAGYELASERLAVALDSGDPEDEHSCFSDNTYNDHLYDLLGVRRVYEHGGAASLAALTRQLDPAMHQRMQRLFDRAEAALRGMPQPFDRLLASPPGSAGRRQAEAAVESLYALTRGLRDLGQTLGVLVVVSG